MFDPEDMRKLKQSSEYELEFLEEETGEEQYLKSRYRALSRAKRDLVLRSVSRPRPRVSFMEKKPFSGAKTTKELKKRSKRPGDQDKVEPKVDKEEPKPNTDQISGENHE